MADSKEAVAKKLRPTNIGRLAIFESMLMNEKIRLLYVTCPDQKTARHISQTLLEEGSIACTNILPAMESHYRWEGKITVSQEVVLIVKTSQGLVDKVTARIETLHPYEVPCVLSLPVESGNLPYLRWLTGSLY